MQTCPGRFLTKRHLLHAATDEAHECSDLVTIAGRVSLAHNRHPGLFELDLVYFCNDMKGEVGIVEIVIFHLLLDEFA